MQAPNQSTAVDLNQDPKPLIRPRAAFGSQLWTMIRHNLQLKGRAKKSLACELIVPLLFFSQLFMFGQMATRLKEFNPPLADFVTEPLAYIKDSRSNWGERYTMVVGFTPNNSQTQLLVREMRKKWMWPTNHNMTLMPFESDKDMEIYFRSQVVQHSDDSLAKLKFEERFIGVVFNVADLSTLSYTIRVSFSMLPPTAPPYVLADNSYERDWCLIKQWGKYDPDGTETARKAPWQCEAASYGRRGFLALQIHLIAAYMEFNSSKKVAPIQLFTHLLPQMASTLLERGQYVAGLPGFCMTIILGTFVCYLVSSAVAEKEARLLSNMQVMGLQPTVYWMAWSLLYFTVIFLVAVICVVGAHFLDVWVQSNLALLVIYCLLYGLAMIALCWCIVPLVRRPLVGSIFMFVVVISGACMFIMDSMPVLTDGDKWGLGFFPSATFTLGITRVTRTELLGFGTGFDNALPAFGYSFGSSIFSLLIDIVVFGLAAIYLEQVFPSDDKQKLVPWFFVLPSYWVSSPKTRSSSSVASTDADIEPVPLQVRQKTAIICRNLRKKFYNKLGTAAVEDFTYEVYEDEILAVLGHNGAGKTTLLNMLVGLLKPTSGHAYIYGQDITDPQQLKIAQTMIGICPQHDVLFDTLTVKEHIVFYARLKGFSDKEAEQEYERTIDCIDMRGHADNKARTLSGGQKRRLCIAIAVVGDPKVLMLDEPTSGVDPFTRSFIWDMVRNFKKGRCVIVTTHSMQEADIHCDRKLIFSHGRIRCAGSSLYLKNRFGAGYYLTMSVEREFSQSQITEFVTSRIPNAKTSRVHGGEISFSLPKDAASKFQSLFSDLDRSLASLKIRSYGITETSLEEIFLKLAQDLPPDVPVGGAKSTVKVDLKNAATVRLVRPKRGAVNGGIKFLKLCKIRFLLALRSKLFWVFHLVLPLILLVLIGLLLQAKNDAATRAATADYLSMSKFGAALRETRVAPACNENAEKNPLVASMEALVGQKFDELSYDQLNQSAPHYVFFEFLNDSTLGKERQTYVDDMAARSARGESVIPRAALGHNSSAPHALPYAANIYLNAVFRNVTGREETFDFAINPFADPIVKAKEAAGGLGYESFLIGFVLLLIPGIYCVDVCRDRTLKLRSQIRMTGCSTWLYWGSAFVSHFIQYTGTFILTIIMMYAFKVTDFTENLDAVIVLFLVHAPAVILFCYCLSFAFRKHTTAMVAIPLPLALAGLLVHFICLLLIMAADNEHQTSENPEADIDHDSSMPHRVCVFLFPFYGYFAGLLKLNLLVMNNTGAKKMGKPLNTGFDWSTDVPIIFVAHAVHIVILVILLTFLESVSFNQTWLQTVGIRNFKFAMPKKLTKPSQNSQARSAESPSTAQSAVLAAVDDDVQMEQHRAQSVDEKQGKSYSLLTRNLWKEYGGPKMCHRRRIAKQVVRDVSVLVPKGEILGLLGPNGAGKSTTLSMIVGEVTPKSGNVFVNGHHMRSDTADAIESMGSCPQTDTLWDDIKMSEHLELFAALNDLPRDQAQTTLDYFVNGLSIREHFLKKASALSGGTKRKLTFMISMMGSPPLVLLDEPSTGMDPQSKRFLWDIITQNFGGDRSAVLTTHSMEEADALCDRICILVNGTMHCIGSSQHLKDKYGSGYVLEIRLSVPPSSVPPRDPTVPAQTSANQSMSAPPTPAVPTATDIAQQKAKAEVLKMFPKANCTEQQHNRMVFTIGRDQISSLGAAFADLDKLKQTLGLEEYSFSQTTLEQVFLHFAAMQESQAKRSQGFVPPLPPFAASQLVPSPLTNIRLPAAVTT